jgi:hypothetical protein
MYVECDPPPHAGFDSLVIGGVVFSGRIAGITDDDFYINDDLGESIPGERAHSVVVCGTAPADVARPSRTDGPDHPD